MEKYLYVELRESFECIDRFVVAYNEFEGYRAIVSNLWHIDGTAYIQIVIQIPFSQLLLLIKQVYSNEGDSFIQCQKAVVYFDTKAYLIIQYIKFYRQRKEVMWLFLEMFSVPRENESPR